MGWNDSRYNLSVGVSGLSLTNKFLTDAFKAEMLKQVEELKPSFDPPVVDLVDKVNALPEVVTISSCCGHLFRVDHIDEDDSIHKSYGYIAVKPSQRVFDYICHTWGAIMCDTGPTGDKDEITRVSVIFTESKYYCPMIKIEFKGLEVGSGQFDRSAERVYRVLKLVTH